MQHEPSYSVNDPKGWMGDPKRGASLGRRDRVGERTYDGVITLRRVRLNADGYDGLGTYWGIPHSSQLYWFASATNHIDQTIWAKNREAARAHVLSLYPNAKVRR